MMDDGWGQRRSQDLQYFLDNVLRKCRYPIVTLSLDVANDPVLGDLTNPESFARWARFIRAGQVLGVVGGPPCETWSVARMKAAFEKLQGERRPPRPLRSKEELWGVPNRSVREGEQVKVGNLLLRATVIFLYLCWACRTPMVMEHPAPTEDWRPDAPSSFHTAELKHLCTLPGVEVHDIEQCALGSPHLKPTRLLGVHIPALGSRLRRLARKGRCPGCAKHVPLTGKTPDGSYRTAPAKQYPPGLCELLALSIVDMAEARGVLEPFSDWPDLPPPRWSRF